MRPRARARGLSTGLWLLALACLLVAPAHARAGKREVRPAAVAGSWYPGDPEILRQTVDRLLAEARPQATPPAGRIRALIAPHAGYRYSGPVAAAAYRLVQGRAVHRVIVLGPSHHTPFRGLSIPEVEAYETPLGRIPLDRAAIARRLRASPLVQDVPEAHAREHSIEMQLPFLQRALAPGWRLVPILVGEMGRDDYAPAAELLRPLADAQTLIVVSSDFTHYGARYRYRPFPPDARAAARLRELDMGAYARIAAHDAEGLLEYRQRTGITACGLHPLMILVDLLPDDAKVTRLQYLTSGALTGSYRESVSYLSAAVTRDRPLAAPAEDPPAEPKARLGPSELRLLHRLACLVVEVSVVPGSPAEDELQATLAHLPPVLRRPSGAFVTANRRGRLRGCIGLIRPKEPLYRAVMKSAVSATHEDPRFPPLSPEEMEGLELEINVLSPPRPIESFREIQIGRDGIILSKDGRHATYLPEVAPRAGWTLEHTLTRLAEKAGLPADAWKSGAHLEVYTSQVDPGPHECVTNRTPASAAPGTAAGGP